MQKAKTIGKYAYNGIVDFVEIGIIGFFNDISNTYFDFMDKLGKEKTEFDTVCKLGEKW